MKVAWKHGKKCAWLLWLAAGAAVAAEPEEFGSLDLEQLANIRLVTASKREQAVKDVPAAVNVVTQDQINRSGATSLAEALRTVPGLNVAQINSGSWAIGARGFQQQFANKLLVMIDGRSVYTPISGGVNWDVQDYLLEDVDRIEVVLGPGGSVWGANAVNGVINIISKSARDTQGVTAYAGGGNEKLVLAGGRYGWQAGTETFGRVYAKVTATGDTELSSGGSADDAMELGQAGFRFDGRPGDQSQWTLQGDGYVGQQDSELDLPSLTSPPTYVKHTSQDSEVAGANLLGSWERTFDADSVLRLRGYYDFLHRDAALVEDQVHTMDLELHHTWSRWERHKIDSGLDYRMSRCLTEDAYVTFHPSDFTTWLVSGYLQDEFWLVRDRLALTAGIKLEYNNHTGLEPQPNVRLLWHPQPAHTLWAAWSRAVRTPFGVENFGQSDLRVFPPGASPPPLPVAVRLTGNPDLLSEKLESWEVGWRWQVSPQLSLAVQGFDYQYDRLVLVETGQTNLQTSPVPAVIITAPYANGMTGESYGGEVSAQWQVLDGWRLHASYAYLQMHLHPYKSDPFAFAGAANGSPRNTAAFQSFLTLARKWDVDLTLRYVDAIPSQDIPSYIELDVRLAWRPNSRWELALVGQNLLHDQHPEYTPGVVRQPSEIERGVYARATVRF